MRLLLVAASGLAREVLAAECARGRRGHVRVLDDDPDRWGGDLAGAQVVGGLDAVTDYDDHAIVVCAGRGAVRREIVERLTRLGVGADRYATVVHPAVEVPRGCTVGRGSILLAGAVLTADVHVGRHVVAMPHVVLTHDDVVEDHATLCAGATLGGGVRVGEAAYLGMRCAVREHVTVGAGATVGMGAVVLRDVPPGETWTGVPARARAVRGAPLPV